MAIEPGSDDLAEAKVSCSSILLCNAPKQLQRETIRPGAGDSLVHGLSTQRFEE
jgi:hypothetical protein